MLARPPRGLKACAIGWLAQREHSRDELRRKLLQRACEGRSADDAEADAPDPSAQVEPLLDWLEAHGYLSPARFADALVHARAPRHGKIGRAHV